MTKNESQLMEGGKSFLTERGEKITKQNEPNTVGYLGYHY